MSKIPSVHPFPARMAPEIALAETASLSPKSVVLDPMAGSGTVLRVASEQGHLGFGVDSDPLAVLMTRVWTTPIDTAELRCAANIMAENASSMDSDAIDLPWIDSDPETQQFIDFWFAKAQRSDLRRLSFCVNGVQGAVGDALRISLSKLIVTKNRGASLARDVSHSRPHRVRTSNDFPVLLEFLRSVEVLCQRLERQPPPGNVDIKLGDARNLVDFEEGTIDAVITSPPYLNAIDYLRGHRLALVWLGYRISELRQIRSENIGTERRLREEGDRNLLGAITGSMAELQNLPSREQGIFDRYVLDLFAMLSEVARVLRSGGKAVFVVGNSSLKGVFVENARVVSAIGEMLGFTLSALHERELPPNQRYLPPPSTQSLSSLGKRMRTETVATYIVP